MITAQWSAKHESLGQKMVQEPHKKSMLLQTADSENKFVFQPWPVWKRSRKFDVVAEMQYIWNWH